MKVAFEGDDSTPRERAMVRAILLLYQNQLWLMEQINALLGHEMNFDNCVSAEAVMDLRKKVQEFAVNAFHGIELIGFEPNAPFSEDELTDEFTGKGVVYISTEEGQKTSN